MGRTVTVGTLTDAKALAAIREALENDSRISVRTREGRSYAAGDYDIVLPKAIPVPSCELPRTGSNNSASALHLGVFNNGSAGLDPHLYTSNGCWGEHLQEITDPGLINLAKEVVRIKIAGEKE